mmetsp:Transcript_36640/g.96567  ORF Transcript_36640/g.96567 Transcript_36640/m.96567 type:complete len:111 (-) Transcript_36640:1876-2208(-)
MCKTVPSSHNCQNQLEAMTRIEQMPMHSSSLSHCKTEQNACRIDPESNQTSCKYRQIPLSRLHSKNNFLPTYNCAKSPDIDIVRHMFHFAVNMIYPSVPNYSAGNLRCNS